MLNAQPLPHGRGSVAGGRQVLVFGLLLALFLLLIARNVSSEPCLYDEADYMYAASLGFAANWTDTPSIPIADFARAGLHGDGQQTLSERIRSANDVLFYRHFHGPLFHYLLIPVSRLGLREHAVRTALLAIPCASLAVVYFGCLWLVAGAKASPTALMAAVLFLSSYSVIRSTELAPHHLFALCSLASLILLMKAVNTGRRAYWYASLVMAGLAFCTLEIALVLLLTLAMVAFTERRCWGADWRFAAKSLAVFLATVLALWPAAILRLSFFKGCATMAYLAWSRESPWGDAGFIETWRDRFFSSPVEWTLVLLGLLIVCARRPGGKERPRVYPVVLFAALMLGATLRVVTLTPRYSLAFVPVLDLLAGLALALALAPARRPASIAVVALAIAGLYGNAWLQALRHPDNPNPRSPAVVTFIHQNKLENKTVLVPQADLPMLHYYFPGMRLRGYYGQYRPGSDREGVAADAILQPGYPVRAEWIR